MGTKLQRSSNLVCFCVPPPWWLIYCRSFLYRRMQFKSEKYCKYPPHYDLPRSCNWKLKIHQKNCATTAVHFETVSYRCLSVRRRIAFKLQFMPICNYKWVVYRNECNQGAGESRVRGETKPNSRMYRVHAIVNNLSRKTCTVLSFSD